MPSTSQNDHVALKNRTQYSFSLGEVFLVEISTFFLIVSGIISYEVYSFLITLIEDR